MKVKYGNGKTEYGPGVEIELDGDEVAEAIDEYLVAKDVVVRGPRTIRVNGELCQDGWVYVDPSGFVINDGVKLSGRGMPTSDEVDSVEGKNKYGKGSLLMANIEAGPSICGYIVCVVSEYNEQEGKFRAIIIGHKYKELGDIGKEISFSKEVYAWDEVCYTAEPLKPDVDYTGVDENE